jgi:hypothetical protein
LKGEKRFAYDYLVPTQGKFIHFVVSSAVGLFIVTLAYFFVDYDWHISFKAVSIIFLYCSVFSLVVWSIAYGYAWLVRQIRG